MYKIASFASAFFSALAQMQAQENRDKLIVLRAEHKALQMKIQQIQDLLAKKESPKVSTLPFYEDA